MPDELVHEVRRLADQVRQHNPLPGDVIDVVFDGPRWGSARVKAELSVLFPEQTVRVK